jgi:hypothetical protein
MLPGCCLTLLGLMQFAEVDPTWSDRIVTAILKFVTFASSTPANKGQGVSERDASRWQDYTMVFQWSVSLSHGVGRKLIRSAQAVQEPPE